MGVVKTWNGIARASMKTFDGIAVASVKTINGFDATASGYTLQQDLGASDNADCYAGYDTTTDKWAFAISFTTVGGYTLSRVSIKMRSAAAGGTNTYSCYVYSNNAGVPGTALKTANTTVVNSALSGSSAYVDFDFNVGNQQALSATTRYWIVIFSDAISTTQYAIGRYINTGTESVNHSTAALPTPTWAGWDGSSQGTLKTYSGP